ncbi:unnamed protein product [Darwinula stevensoni]|uniref:Large subunit GTPase 1 homolog n=1 Tax=Darwinula stevensoni TaxID=69355 RepID=A0A7R8XDT6_9CRUS|nr:unnamed protein product [Darwinula stevensoni]CAG0888990.1 unnamed protein product [Darwinula stevensoni]
MPMAKSKKTGLGRTIIKDRFSGSRRSTHGESMLHTADLQDGYDWNRLKLKSVTENNQLDDFLSTAELAGTEFTAEKQNIQFVDISTQVRIMSDEEKLQVKKLHDDNRKFLSIPRRPKWNVTTTPEELDAAERESFLSWRRQLAEIQEIEGLIITPFEKNLEFWRQLWRVVERSDVVVQILDARNPLLFHCEDLEAVVKEVSPEKENMVLLNKADLLSLQQRRTWAKYFAERGIKAVFYSATEQMDNIQQMEHDAKKSSTKDAEEDDPEMYWKVPPVTNEESGESEDEVEVCAEQKEFVPEPVKGTTEQEECVTEQIEDPAEPKECPEKQESSTVPSLGEEGEAKCLTREELMEVFRAVHTGSKFKPGLTTIGMVGYPNVGKSSTINSLLQSKKVSVSTTPGKTKHFQTIFLSDTLCLCDCPGLVMPKFVSTKAEMIISGILPIDQMRDHVPPIALVCSLFPRHVLEDMYGIVLPQAKEGEDPGRPPTVEELLNAYGYMRGFMTPRGLPDHPRSARYILKDVVNGRLLYNWAPSGVDQVVYHTFPPPKRKDYHLPMGRQQQRIHRSEGPTVLDLDQEFFSKLNTKAHTKGNVGVVGHSQSGGLSKHSSVTTISDGGTTKPWKKHHNKKKKEKLRRVYAHLDD